MKITRFILIALLFGLSIGSLNAQELKFGHVNRQEILAAMPELKGVETQLESESSKLENQLTIMQEDLKRMESELTAAVQTMSKELLMEKQQELYQANQKVQQFYSNAQQSLQQKEQQLKMPLIEKMNKAIQDVGLENGFLYIFEANSGIAVYKSAKSIDVSALVKTKLGIQ